MFNQKVVLYLTITFSLTSVVHCSPSPSSSTTTSPPTTTRPSTTVPPGSCLYNQIRYENGETIEEDSVYNCYGTICDNGNVLSWDDKCFFYTPECSGTLEKVVGKCCPDCHETTTPTTTPPPTTPTTTIPTSSPSGGCFINGKMYQEGETISNDKDYNCYGSICQDGHELAWDHECFFTVPPCNGRSRKVKGQCCPECDNVTTTPLTTVTTTSAACYINGTKFATGQRTNTDPCYMCSCYNDEEVCTVIDCEETLDCEIKYRPYGTCCFTCGSSKLESALTWLVLVATVLTNVFHKL